MTQIHTDVEQRDPRTHAIIGAALEVHKILGHGFLEAVYHQSMAVEFASRNVQFARELALPVQYKGQLLLCFYKADFVCFSSVLVELKAVDTLVGSHRAQILNYLKATGLTVGLLINFGAMRLQYERFVL
jgi:GxxExxY protein